MGLKTIRKIRRTKQEPIFCLEQYVIWVEKFFDQHVGERDEDFVLFRGQDCIERPKPRLGRIFLRDETLKEAEKNMLQKFKIESIPFINPIPETEIDWLSVAQHHRLPTRLLDWTKNALAALWFAIQEAEKKSPPEKPTDLQRGVVWVLLSEQKAWMNADQIDRTFDPLKTSRVRFFRPRHFERRISAQSGYFSLHPMKQGGFEVLKSNDSGVKQLKKIEIHPEAFCMLRDQLDHYNVNYSTMFPDLDGISKNIEWLHSRFNDEQGCDKDGHHCIKNIKQELAFTVKK